MEYVRPKATGPGAQTTERGSRYRLEQRGASFLFLLDLCSQYARSRDSCVPTPFLQRDPACFSKADINWYSALHESRGSGMFSRWISRTPRETLGIFTAGIQLDWREYAALFRKLEAGDRERLSRLLPWAIIG